ncbi:MAG: flagellar motor protein MotB [bacterium]
MILRSIRFYQQKIKEDAIWLTIYSDLMTNLMLFFLLMFGLSRMPPEMRAKIAEGVQNNFRAQPMDANLKRIIKRFREEESVFQMKEVIEKKELESFTKLEVDEERIKLTLRDPVLFAPGDAKISKEKAGSFMRELAAIFQGLPNQIIIEGHTDSMPVKSGKYKNNWELSVARALSVEEILEENGVDPQFLGVAGYAEYAPLFPNATKVGRSFNRRVEISIVR